MTIASGTQFHVYLPWGRVSSVKAVVATFNQEKALVGASSVIVQLHRLIVYSTTRRGGWAAVLQCQAWDGECWGEDGGGFIYLVQVGLDVR